MQVKFLSVVVKRILQKGQNDPEQVLEPFFSSVEESVDND